MTGRDFKPGDRFSRVVVENLTRTQIVQYAGASGDYTPLHTDEVYAVKVAGYPSVFAHGMLSMGLTSGLLTELLGPEGLRRYGCRFVNQVWPGDSLESRAEVKEIRVEDGERRVEFTLSTVNQHGREVLTGYAVGTISAGGH